MPTKPKAPASRPPKGQRYRLVDKFDVHPRQRDIERYEGKAKWRYVGHVRADDDVVRDICHALNAQAQKGTK